VKIGVLTGIWYVAESATLLESLRRAARLGFRYVDFHGVFHAGPSHLSLEERIVVRKEISALGLVPRNYVLHPLHNLPSSSQEELEKSRKYLEQGIDLAVEWGINQVMLNAGQWAFGIPRVEAWERSVRFLQRLCDYAASRGVYIAQEPEPYVWFLVSDLASAARMYQDVGRGNFTTLIDLGHMALAREDPQALEPLAESLIHAHFSDHKPHQHTNQIIGTGFTPTAEYLDKLCQLHIDQKAQRFGYDEFVVSFELGVPGDSIENPDDWIAQSIQNVQKAAPYMTLGRI
jgi:sugar phosphate isomerase/epimerase